MSIFATVCGVRCAPGECGTSIDGDMFRVWLRDPHATACTLHASAALERVHLAVREPDMSTEEFVRRALARDPLLKHRLTLLPPWSGCRQDSNALVQECGDGVCAMQDASQSLLGMRGWRRCGSPPHPPCPTPSSCPLVAPWAVHYCGGDDAAHRCMPSFVACDDAPHATGWYVANKTVGPSSQFWCDRGCVAHGDAYVAQTVCRNPMHGGRESCQMVLGRCFLRSGRECTPIAGWNRVSGTKRSVFCAPPGASHVATWCSDNSDARWDDRVLCDDEEIGGLHRRLQTGDDVVSVSAINTLFGLLGTYQQAITPSPYPPKPPPPPPPPPPVPPDETLRLVLIISGVVGGGITLVCVVYLLANPQRARGLVQVIGSLARLVGRGGSSPPPPDPPPDPPPEPAAPSRARRPSARRVRAEARVSAAAAAPEEDAPALARPGRAT